MWRLNKSTELRPGMYYICIFIFPNFWQLLLFPLLHFISVFFIIFSIEVVCFIFVIKWRGTGCLIKSNWDVYEKINFSISSLMKGRGDKCVLDTELSLTYSQSYFHLIFQSIVRPLWQNSRLKSWNRLESKESISLPFSPPHDLLEHAGHL